MKSMTGFGMGEYTAEEESITVEIKTVNHRYKDFNFRMNSRLNALEDNARKLIGNFLNRGHIEVNARYYKYADSSIKLHYDEYLADEYKKVLDLIHSQFPNLQNEVSVIDIARYPSVITTENETEDMDALWEKFAFAINQAMEMLNKAREAEGQNLKEDMIKRISDIEVMVKDIELISETLPKQYYETLKKNALEYTENALNEDRLYTELALYADRVNTTEELVRLNSHIADFKKTAELSEPVGRKLDFTLQEINREVNTIASKSNSYEISSIVINIKAELEKIREQVQNIE